jgi:hypothetical protein
MGRKYSEDAPFSLFGGFRVNLARTSRHVMVVVALAAMALSSWAAPPSNAPPPARGRGRGPAMPASLGSAMQDMDRAFRALQAEVADPAKLDQALKDIATMQRDAAISKTLTPPSVNRLADDKKAAATESYRLKMVGLMKALLDLEDAVASKKSDDVKKGLQAIEEIMKQGHAEFAPDMNR